jgi:hypothetical protein
VIFLHQNSYSRLSLRFLILTAPKHSKKVYLNTKLNNKGGFVNKIIKIKKIIFVLSTLLFASSITLFARNFGGEGGRGMEQRRPQEFQQHNTEKHRYNQEHPYGNRYNQEHPYENRNFDRTLENEAANPINIVPDDSYFDDQQQIQQEEQQLLQQQQQMQEMQQQQQSES